MRGKYLRLIEILSRRAPEVSGHAGLKMTKGVAVGIYYWRC